MCPQNINAQGITTAIVRHDKEIRCYCTYYQRLLPPWSAANKTSKLEKQLLRFPKQGEGEDVRAEGKNKKKMKKQETQTQDPKKQEKKGTL